MIMDFAECTAATRNHDRQRHADVLSLKQAPNEIYSFEVLKTLFCELWKKIKIEKTFNNLLMMSTLPRPVMIMNVTQTFQ